MSTAISRTGTNDISLTQDGRYLVLDSGQEAYANIIESAILTQKGELQLNPEQGIPYFESVFSSPSKARIWETAVRQRIEQFPWVVSIVDFVYNFNASDNQLDYEIRVSTDLGIVTARNRQ